MTDEAVTFTSMIPQDVQAALAGLENHQLAAMLATLGLRCSEDTPLRSLELNPGDGREGVVKPFPEGAERRGCERTLYRLVVDRVRHGHGVS